MFLREEFHRKFQIKLLRTMFCKQKLLKMALFRSWGKILLSGTYPSSKDPGGKFWFQLQISKIWVWLDSEKALEPLFDLLEAQGKTSNLGPKPSFRRGNLEKSSAPRWCDAPNLGAPKFFWGASYTYILIFKRVFEVTWHFTFCWTNYMRFLTINKNG